MIGLLRFIENHIGLFRKWKESEDADLWKLINDFLLSISHGT